MADEYIVDTSMGIVHWRCKCEQPNAITRDECVNCGKAKPTNIKVIGYNRKGKPWKGRGRKPKNWNGELSA